MRGLKDLLKGAKGTDALLTTSASSSIEQQLKGCLAELLKAQHKKTRQRSDEMVKTIPRSK